MDLFALENGHGGQTLRGIEFYAAEVSRRGTHQPVDHLTWIHNERPEETNEAITEYSSRERCKNGRSRANFRVIVKLETAHIASRVI